MVHVTISGSRRKNVCFSRILCVLLLTCLILPVPSKGHGHSHDHDHDHDHIHEPASFKYSKQANEQFSKEHSHSEHHHHHVDRKGETSQDLSDIFVRAMGSTLLISIAPFLLLFILPIDNSQERQPFLKILLSFASGGLLGDAFLHLIPHALVPHSHNLQAESDSHSHSHGDRHGHHHSHDHEHHGHGHDMSVGLCVLLGIVTFLVVEKLVRIIKGDGEHTHSHSHDHKEISIAAYLNLAADFLHNFTDGLAIGASYLAGESVGYVTTFTILLHEVPHEIGDFAILIQSGCSKKKVLSD